MLQFEPRNGRQDSLMAQVPACSVGSGRHACGGACDAFALVWRCCPVLKQRAAVYSALSQTSIRGTLLICAASATCRCTC